MTEYASLDKEELVRRLKELEEAMRSGDHGPDNKVYLDLHAHQIELEMQNRELMEAQRDLVESLHRYADLYDNAPSGYLTFDWKGCIKEMNLTAAALMGCDRALIVGMPFAQFLPKEEMKRFLDHIRQCRNSGAQVYSEFTLERRADASVEKLPKAEVHIRLITVPSGSGANALFKSTLIDITRIKAAESEKDAFREELLRSQRTELMGRLAGGMVHEFTNLMTVVSAYTNLAARESKKSATMAGYLDQIKGAADRAGNLIRRLLIFSNSKTTHIERLELNALLQDLSVMMGKIVGPKMRLETLIQPGLWAIDGDSVKFEQLVLNLIVNARDEMPFGGTALLKAANTVHNGKNFVRISLDHSKIESTGDAPGSGLVIRELAEDLNGMLEGKNGHIVSILIPAACGTAARKEKKKSEPLASGSSPRVLLVEDEHALRKSVAIVLLRHGYTVLEASDAKEALDIFTGENGNIDLVFTDLILKDRNGMELIEDLVNKREDVNVLVTSGYMDVEAQWPAIRERGYKYIQKPFEIPDLLTAVKESIG